MLREKATLLLAARLCTLGFLVNCQPSEPFLTSYLLHTKNLTDTQLSSEVWPWSTTGTFILLLPAALLAEVIGARPVILAGLVCRECARVILIFAEGVPWMAAMQLAYAGGVAANAIYFSYVYTAVTPEHYATITALVLAAYHAGNVVAALVAQALVSYVPAVAADLTPLFYLSWGFTTLGITSSLLLPPPAREPPIALARQLLRHGPRAALVELCEVYRPPEVRAWLCWWLLGSSVQTVVMNYFQLQLSEASIGGDAVPYGLLEASIELSLVVGSLSAPLMAGVVHRWPAAFMGLTSALRAAAYMLSAAGATHKVVVLPFLMNPIAATFCALQQAVGSSIVAAGLTGTHRYALVFSANTLLANGIAAILGNIGASLRWTANPYYWAVGFIQLSLVALAPLFVVRSNRKESDVEERPAITDCTTLQGD